MTRRPVTDYERREDQAIDPEPDFVDVHVKLDWVIRVHGQTDPGAATQVAMDFVGDQPVDQLVYALAHEDGVLCDGDDESEVDYDTGHLREDALTVALYPEDTFDTIPANIPVAVSTYGPSDRWGPASHAEAKAELNKLVYDLRHGVVVRPVARGQQPTVSLPYDDAMRSVEVLDNFLNGGGRSELGNRIRDWDEAVEDEGAPEDKAMRPFEAGVMLAVASLIDVWEDGSEPQRAEAMQALRETVREVIE